MQPIGNKKNYRSGKISCLPIYPFQGVDHATEKTLNRHLGVIPIRDFKHSMKAINFAYFKLRIMQKFIVAILLSLPLLGHAQIHINESKEAIKNTIEQLKSYNPASTFTIAETDSSLNVVQQDADNQRIEKNFSFDKNGKCQNEFILYTCQNCYAKTLQTILSKTSYKWKKINENQYISRFEDKLMLELPSEKDVYKIYIIRANWNKIIYDMITGQ